MNEIIATGWKDPIPLQPSDRRYGFNIPASAPTIRKERRALVKALGSRQFKKLYRSAP